MRNFLPVLAAIAVLAPPGMQAAAAQDYPNKPIRVLTNIGTGGTGDIYIRALGERLFQRLGHPLIVEPKPGGAFTLAGRACAEAAPDGYTICMLTGETLNYNRYLFKQIPYDPDKFVPITNLFFNTQALVVNAKLGVKTLDQLASHAKANPKTLSYVAPSIPLYLFMEKFNKERGTDIVRVPFRGGGQATAGILSGTTPIAFFGLANFMSHLKAGTMNGLLIDGAQRSPLFPDIPTLAEIGYRGNLTRVYFGLVAPPGMPRPMVDKLQKEIAAIMREPEFRQKQLIDRALEPIADTPGEFAQFLKRDRELSERVVKESGLPPK